MGRKTNEREKTTFIEDGGTAIDICFFLFLVAFFLMWVFCDDIPDGAARFLFCSLGLDIWSLGGSIRCVGKEEYATGCHFRLMEEGMGKRKIRARERQVDKMKPTRAIFLDDTKQTKRWGPFLSRHVIDA